MAKRFLLTGHLRPAALPRAHDFVELVLEHGGTASVVSTAERVTIAAAWPSHTKVDVAAERLRDDDDTFVDLAYELLPDLDTSSPPS